MLTGDKGETALEVGYSCGLFDNSKLELIINKVDHNDENNLQNKL